MWSQKSNSVIRLSGKGLYLLSHRISSLAHLAFKMWVLGLGSGCQYLGGRGNWISDLEFHGSQGYTVKPCLGKTTKMWVLGIKLNVYAYTVMEPEFLLFF